MLSLLFASLLAAEPGFHQSDLYKAAKEYCNHYRLNVYPYHERYIGNKEGIFAPFTRTKDGGILIVATAEEDGRAVVLKLNQRGKVVWQKSFRKEGRQAIEGGSAVETNGGYYVFTQVYWNPSTMGQIWLLKLDNSGSMVWELGFRGFGNDNNPAADRLMLSDKGSVLIKGHIYPTLADMRNERSHPWGAEVGPDGKVVSDVTDPPGMPDGDDDIDARYPW